VVALNVEFKIADRVCTGAGLSDCFPLASMHAHLRNLRPPDGAVVIDKPAIAHPELARSGR
jgi:acyl-CoA dehydrogenase